MNLCRNHARGEGSKPFSSSSIHRIISVLTFIVGDTTQDMQSRADFGSPVWNCSAQSTFSSCVLKKFLWQWPTKHSWGLRGWDNYASKSTFYMKFLLLTSQSLTILTSELPINGCLPCMQLSWGIFSSWRAALSEGRGDCVHMHAHAVLLLQCLPFSPSSESDLHQAHLPRCPWDTGKRVHPFLKMFHKSLFLLFSFLFSPLPGCLPDLTTCSCCVGKQQFLVLVIQKLWEVLS